MKIYIASAIGIMALLLLIMLSPFTIIGSGQRGVVVRFGHVSDNVLSEGFHFIHPLDNVEKVDVRTQVIEWDDGLAAASKDLQSVNIDLVVNYHQDPQLVWKIFQEYGEQYQTNILNPIVRETVKEVSAQYTAEELVTRRSEFSSQVETLLQERFTNKMAVLENSSVANLNFSQAFNEAIEAKVTAEQDALASKNKLEQTKYEAEQTIVKAQAEAEAIRIQAEAITQQGGQAYVDLQAVNRWNGVLPSYVMGDAIPFITTK